MILEILEKVAETGSSKVKQQIIQDNVKNETLKRVFRMAYSKRIMYGIKKFPQPGEQSQSYGMLTLDDGLDLLENVLATRQLTGNAAIKELSDFIADMKPGDVEVIRRVIARDLRIGAGSTIANKVWKNLIPAQPQMLANPYSEKNVSHIKFPAYAQLKADGARCFAEIKGDTVDDVKLLSRAGNEYLGLDKLKAELIKATANARETNPDGILIDGELVWFAVEPQVEDNLDSLFGESSEEQVEQIVSSRTEGNGIANKALKGTISAIEADGIKFQVWDFVPLTTYQGFKSAAYQVRFHELSEAVKGLSRVILIENTIVNDIKEARAVYAKYVEQGLEGIILKNVFGLWEDRRSKNQVKFKEVIAFDLECVDTYPHRQDPNKLGGVYLRSKCGRIRVKAGSGFKDTTHIKDKKGEWQIIPMSERDELDREYLWSIRDELLGTIFEGECNNWLTAEGRKEPYVSLFLPIIKKRRHDKTTANTFEDIFGVNFTEATGIK